MMYKYYKKGTSSKYAHTAMVTHTAFKISHSIYKTEGGWRLGEAGVGRRGWQGEIPRPSRFCFRNLLFLTLFEFSFLARISAKNNKSLVVVLTIGLGMSGW